MIDSHCHLNLEAFDPDRGEVINRSLKDLRSLIIVGNDVSSSRRCWEMATIEPKIFATAGIHPENVGKTQDRDFLTIENLAVHEKVVAIGEIGLDYFHLEKESGKIRSWQKDLFARQLLLSQKLNKPVVVHNRLATSDTLGIARDFSLPGRAPGVFHSTTETDRSLIKQILDCGFYLGFTGIITFKNANALREVVKYVPLEKMLLETDAPYLTPEPLRGNRNEPLFVREVLKKVAEIKNLPLSKVEQVTDNNVKELFLNV